MKLFIFEPYSWVYCGGAIGVIADTFDGAVDAIMRTNKNDGFHSDYKKKHFSESADTFKEDHYDQWLLTHTIEIYGEQEARVLFDNWHYA